MRRISPDDGRTFDLVSVERDSKHAACWSAFSDMLYPLQGLACKAVADVSAAFARQSAARCSLIQTGALHMLGWQHRDVGVDCIGETACGMLLLPTRQHSEVDKGAPTSAVLAAAAAALRAHPRALRVLVVSGRCGETRAVDDRSLSDHRFEVGAMPGTVVIVNSNHLGLAVLEPYQRGGRFLHLQLAASGSQGCGVQRLHESRRVCLSRLVSAPRRTAEVNTTPARQRVEHGAAMTADRIGWRGFQA